MGPGLHVEVKHLVEPLLGRESPAKNWPVVEGVRPAFKKPYEILLDGNGWQSLHKGNGERNGSGDGKGDAPYSEGALATTCQLDHKCIDLNLKANFCDL